MEGERDRVYICAANTSKVISIFADGTCERHVAVPGVLLKQLTRRHPDAEHLAIVESEVGINLSIRTFSQNCSLQISGPECFKASVVVPQFEPGPFQNEPTYFNPHLVADVLRAIRHADHLEMIPFSLGLIIKGTSDNWQCKVFLAGSIGSQ